VQVLDAFHHGGVDGHPSVRAIIAESKQLQEKQDLFELYVQVHWVAGSEAGAAWRVACLLLQLLLTQGLVHWAALHGAKVLAAVLGIAVLRPHWSVLS
jgi:hypothetical protein